MKRVTDKQIKHACLSSKSMAEAAATLQIHFNTLKSRAVKLDCYKPNQSGKGKTKQKTCHIPMQEILEGKHPHYQTYKLKQRLLKSGIIKNVCEICGISEWLGQQLTIELDHIDGDRTNHRLSNLRMLCPNCPSQTKTFRNKPRN